MVTRSKDTAPSWARSSLLALGAVALLAISGCANDIDRQIEQAKQDASGGKLYSPDSLIRVAEHTARGGDVGTALTLFNRASMAAPDNPVPILRMAQLYYAVAAYKEAEVAYGRVIGIDPDHVDALRGLGNTLVALDQPERAIPAFEAALKIERDPRTLAGLGVAHDMAGRRAKAQEIYRAGLAEHPAHLGLRNNLGLSLAMTGRTDEAIAILRKVANSPGATARHRLNLALAYGLAGRSGMAAELLQLDLDAKQVQRNLAYYRWLRDQAADRAGTAPPPPLGNAPGQTATGSAQAGPWRPVPPRDLIKP